MWQEPSNSNGRESGNLTKAYKYCCDCSNLRHNSAMSFAKLTKPLPLLDRIRKKVGPAKWAVIKKCASNAGISVTEYLAESVREKTGLHLREKN